MSKLYDSESSLRKKILNGVNKLDKNVGSTMGPRGNNVVLQSKGGKPIVTKDGVSVSRFMELKDPVENVGIQILKQAAEETNLAAGDGTTTSTVIASELYRQSYKQIELGHAPIEIKKGIEAAAIVVTEKLKENSRPISSIDDIRHVATVSANGDKVIGDIVAQAIDMIGKDGSITVQEARSTKTSLEVKEGFRIKNGYVSPRFITDEARRLMRYEKPLILITDEKITSVQEMMPALELASRASRPIVFIVEDIEGEALAALIMNTVRGNMKAAAIKAPGYGEERRNILNDLALTLGAEVLSKSTGKELSSVCLEQLGEADIIEATRSQTTFVGGLGSDKDIEERVEGLRREREETENLHEAERVQERITRLSSGVAIIKVGASTEVEMTEKKYRIEDALEAVRSAQEEGIVPGGGTALLRAAHNIEVHVENNQQMIGAQILISSIEAPMRRIVDNANDSFDIVNLGMREHINSSEKNMMGYNASIGEYQDMIEAGVIDPVKVTRCALQNAVSAVGALIMTSHCIIEIEE